MARDRKPSIAMRLKSLDEAIDLARGRASDEVVEAADAVVDRAGHRLSIAGEHTVVALAGATGSGKSSTFNAISGTKLARTGVTRPTTSEAMSVSWGTEQPVELLDWLDVQRRQQARQAELDRREAELRAREQKSAPKDPNLPEDPDAPSSGPGTGTTPPRS